MSPISSVGEILQHCRNKIMIIDTVLFQLNGIEIKEKYLMRFRTLIKSDSIWKLVFNSDKGIECYTPNITITKLKSINGGWYTERIEIQFSAPMIINETNYFGIDEQEREIVMDVLFKKLCRIFDGQPLSKNHLMWADLRIIAFAFNLILSDKSGYPIEFLKMIPLLDMGKNYRGLKANYYDQDAIGFCVRIFNKQASLRAYDKGVQIINTAKTTKEKEIASKIKQRLLPDKVLRIEVTYQNRTALKKHLATKIDGDPKKERHLMEIFNNKLCQSILLEAFDELFNSLDIQALDFPLYSPNEAYKIAKKAGLSQYDAWALIGRSAIVTQAGSLQLKLISDNHYDRRDRSRNDKKLTKIITAHPLPSFTLKQVITECRKQLVEFNVMKLNDYD